MKFPILNQKIHGQKLVYLDNAATTQKPQSVIDAEKKYYEEYNSNVHRSVHFLAEIATQKYEEAREKVASYINAQLREVVFTSGTTESINLVARGLESHLKSYENPSILLTEIEHHANLVPWQELAKRTGAKLQFIRLNKTGDIDYSDFEDKINSDTAIVALTHASNVLGVVKDVVKICKLAREWGAISVVDGAQAIAHMPINVKEINCDFYVFSGHKIYGPTGIGVLYGKKEMLELLEPSKFGGDMIKTVTLEKSSWNDTPYKFEAGTPNIAGAIVLGTAIDFLKSIDWKKEREKEKQITKYILAELGKIEGVKVFGPNERIPVFSFIVKGMHAHDVSAALDTFGIATRAGHHCCMPLHEILGVAATTRVSFAHYNTLEDAKFFIKALKEIAKSTKKTSTVRPTEEKVEDDSQSEITQEILHKYHNPKNKLTVKDYTCTANAVNPLCGDAIELFVKVNKNKIENIGFTGSGCAVSQVSADLLCDFLKGKHVKELEKVNEEKIQQLLGLKLGVVRMKCAMLSVNTAKKALRVK